MAIEEGATLVRIGTAISANAKPDENHLAAALPCAVSLRRTIPVQPGAGLASGRC